MSLKVCHVTSSHPRYDGRIFQKECTSLAKKYDVTLLCSDLNKDEEKNNVKIKSINIDNKSRKNRFFVIPKALKKACILVDADVYHFHDPELLSLAKFMKKRGKKVIFDSHEDNVNRIDDRSWLPKFIKPLFKKLYASKERKVFSKSDAIITVTSHIYDRLVKINSNTYIITNYPLFDEVKKESKKNNNVLCFAGGVDRQYMHHNILKALEGIDASYIVAGSYSDAYFEELKNIDGFKKAKFLGKVSKEECNKLYLESNIGLVLIDYVPNINYKHGSMGITKIFEYMMYGLPVIATDLDVWLDFVPNNCGICVNPNNVDEIHDAIKYLIDNPKEAQMMGENGKKLVLEKYNWLTQEKVLYDIYEKIFK